MTDLDPDAKLAITDHAILTYPEECCGFIVSTPQGQRYLPCHNRATNPREHFAIAAEDYADAEDIGPLLAVVHSHPNARAIPSPADRAVCEKVGIPAWVIVSVGVEADGRIGVHDWHSFGPSGYVAPLIGRPFVHGVHDCYSIVRDWYAQERGITIPDFERSDRWWEQKGQSLYMDNYARAGFVDVGPHVEPEEGDVLLMTVLSKHGEPNHAGVYVGGGRFIHHLYGRLSVQAIFGGMWAQCLTTILRHKGA
ncbi:C40 family peptidase [Paraburkholderia sp. J8-2]|uniref:C40 family peptidase n=1 Tax=Paraburkholderia sp. J8-2 TaxID=2805440 RepID=UPI002AB67FD9|nr:C40 family peptidase [Paraburkholderia sp. J8-2]